MNAYAYLMGIAIVLTVGDRIGLSNNGLWAGFAIFTGYAILLELNRHRRG